MNFGLHIFFEAGGEPRVARDARTSRHRNSTQRRRAIAPSHGESQIAQMGADSHRTIATLQPRKHKDEARQGNVNFASTGRVGFDIVPDRPPGGASSQKMSAQPGVHPKPTRTSGKPRPIGVPGTPLCWNHHPAPPRAPHNGATGLPRVAPRGHFSRLQRRPPLAQSAWSIPSPLPPNDHADCATLGRQRRPRRPVPIEPRDRDRDRGGSGGNDRGRVPVLHRRQPGWLSVHNPQRSQCSDRLPACRRQRPRQRLGPEPRQGRGQRQTPDQHPAGETPAPQSPPVHHSQGRVRLRARVRVRVRKRIRPRNRKRSRFLILSSPALWSAEPLLRLSAPASPEQRGRVGEGFEGCDHAARAPAACLVAGRTEFTALPVECPAAQLCATRRGSARAYQHNYEPGKSQ